MFSGVIDLDDPVTVIVPGGEVRNRLHEPAYGFPPRPFAAGAQAEQMRSTL